MLKIKRARSLIMVLIIAFLAIKTPAGAQPTDTTKAKSHFNVGLKLWQEQQYEESIISYRKALEIYEEAGTWPYVAQCYNQIANCQWRLNSNEEARTTADQALKVSNKYLGENSIYAADAFDNIAESYYGQSNFEETRKFYKKAFKIRSSTLGIDDPQLARSHSKLGKIFLILDELDSSLTYYQEALQRYLDIHGKEHVVTGKAYDNLGSIYEERENFDLAIDYYLKAKEILELTAGKSSIEVSRVLNHLGVAYQTIAQYDQAWQSYQEALRIIKSQYGENHQRVASTYLNIGVLKFRQGNYEVSLDYFERSLAIAKAIYGDRHIETAKAMENVSLVQSYLGRHDATLKTQKKALEIYVSILGEEHSLVAGSYHNVGATHEYLENYSQALKYYQKAQVLYEKTIGLQNEHVGINISSIARNFHLNKQYQKAIEYHHRALNLYENLLGPESPRVGVAINEIASIYLEIGEPDNAYETYSTGLFRLQSLMRKIRNDSLQLIEPGKPFSILRLLSGQAKSLVAKYHQDTTRVDYLSAAVSINHELHAFAGKIEKSFQRRADKLSFYRSTTPYYHQAIDAMILLTKATGSNKLYERLFDYSEVRKSNLLRGLLNDQRARKFAGLEDGLLQFESELIKTLSTNKSELIQAKAINDSVKITGLQRDIFHANNQLDSLVNVLSREYPKYFELKYERKEISHQEVQAALPDSTTFLEYYVNDNGAVTAMIISKEIFEVRNWQVDSLQQLVKSLKIALVENDLLQYLSSGRRLYQDLLAPVEKLLQGSNLIIVPDGPLWHVNFDVLLTQETLSKNPKELPYLLNQYALSYASSGAVLFNDLSASQTRTLKECLAFSYADSAHNSKGRQITMRNLRSATGDLPGSRKEIKAISKILNGAYFYGEQASEGTFKREAKKYAIIHLALHGTIDNQDFENSKLHFTDSYDSLEDNLLYSHELYAMDIPSELVVLSACNTGEGEVASGEGIMSVGNAFQFAGAKSLLLSNWELSDEDTPDLIKLFYTHLRNGDNKAKALQKAKQMYLQNQTDVTKVAPYYWAGFYVLGNPRPIVWGGSQQSNYWLWIGLALCLIIAGMIAYRRTQRTS